MLQKTNSNFVNLTPNIETDRKIWAVKCIVKLSFSNNKTRQVSSGRHSSHFGPGSQFAASFQWPSGSQGLNALESVQRY